MKNLYHEPKSHQTLAYGLGVLPATLVLIVYYILKLIVKVLKKFKTQLWKASVITSVVFFLTAFFMPMVDAPKADASHPYTEAVATPTPSELENIVAYIARVFEPEGKDVVVKAINCFYSESGLRSNAHGINSDKEQSEDWGVAQLNDYWQKLTPEQKTDIYANIDKAYEIYKGRGDNFDAWYGKGCK